MSNPLQRYIPSAALLRALSASVRVEPQVTSECCRRASNWDRRASQYRQLTTSAICLASSPSPLKPAEPRTPEWNHQRYKDGELIPKPLSRPLGLLHPPRSGENTGLDTRSTKEKREDFADYGKHLQKRRGLLSDLFERNYYRDIGNLGKVHKGKSILAPTTPFRASLALYFPNLQGFTLSGGAGLLSSKDYDTTPALHGRISIVSMINTEWANDQVKSFVSEKNNEALHTFVREQASGLVQFATINVEENPLKAWMIRVFWRRLRRIIPRDQWATYFLNRRGLSTDIRDAIGMWNSKVGYVYLLDGSCRIRWAGNGYAREEEKKSLVACVKRLCDEAQAAGGIRVQREDAKSMGRSYKNADRPLQTAAAA